MAEPTDLRTLAIAALDLKMDGHLGDSYTLHDLADAVLAAVLPAHREQIAEELRAVARNQSGWLWFEVGEGALERVANHLAATGPQAGPGASVEPERAEVVPEVTPGPDDAAESDEGYEPFVAGEHYTKGPTYLDLVPRADLAKVTAERDRLAETIQQVRELHRPGDFPDCRACGDPWPCPTAAALGDTGQADDRSIDG